MIATVLSSVEAGMGRLVLNHHPHNILTREVLAYIRGDLDRLARDSTLRVLLIVAEGKHFSVGADVTEHLPPEHQDMIHEFIETVRAIDAFPLPVVVGVRGRCLGGAFELVQAADIVVASETAMFGQPEIVLGVFPPAACALLPERCAGGVAADLIFTGDPIDAGEAQRVGIVRQVVPDRDLDRAALELATRIARHSGPVLRLAKRALRNDADGRHRAALTRAGELYVDELMDTQDAIEGLNAFLEKRKPVWRNQ